MTTALKVCFWGNQDNGGYRFCKWMRELGVEADLYMMVRDNARSYPESVDKALEGGYPEWIKRYDNSRYRTLVVPRSLVRQINQSYDVIVASGLTGMINAFQFDIPLICMSTGPTNLGVVRMEAFSKGRISLRWEIARFLCRKSVRKADRVVTHYDPEIYSLSKIGQSGKQVMFGWAEDVVGNRNRVDQQLLSELNSKYSKYEKVFLWLSRVNFLDKEGSEYKGAEKFLSAVERIIKDDKRNIRVVLGRHGYDWESFVQMVNDRGLTDYFDYVDHLPFWQLLTYLSIDNAIVFDELTDLTATSSGMFREAMSVGAVLVKSINELLTSLGHGPGCPALPATSEDEVYQRLQEAMAWSPAEWEARKKDTLDWAMKYVHWEPQLRKLILLFREVVYSRRTVERLQGRF